MCNPFTCAGIRIRGRIHFGLLAAIAIFSLTLGGFAAAQAPRTINYQGYLVNFPSGTPANGTLPMSFALYPVATGGAAVWTEAQSSVVVSNGTYNIRLGSVTPIPPSLSFNNAYFLGVSVGADAEMTPRHQLTAAPYAMFAVSAGCTVGDFISCYTGAAGTMGVGPCKAGTRTCDPATLSYGACSGQVLPVAEILDGIDNDCNGVVDNGVKLAQGTACTSDFQCNSSFCTDGVCSDSRCGGTCEKSNLPGSAGICNPIPLGQDPDNECATQAVSSCGTTGLCNGARACQLYAAGTVCAATVCVGNTSQAASTCNGSSVCLAGTSTNCAPYACNAGSGACSSSCTTNSECVSGYSCALGQCKKSPGAACAVNSECSSGVCTGNVCQ